MRTISVAIFALCAAFSAAKADDAYWPRDPQGYPALIDAELRETIRANTAHAQALREYIIANGGINADWLPVWVAIHPNVHWGAFGQGKTIGSNGE